MATGMLATGHMSPQAKLAMIERLKAQGHRVLMVGDGLNDGPALAAGHVSLAPSSASDASWAASANACSLTPATGRNWLA